MRTIGTKRAMMMVLPPCFFVERVGFLQIRLAEDFGIGVGKEFSPEKLADHEVGGIAQNRGGQKQRDHDMNIHAADCGNPARGKQQRIARQKRRNHQTGFAENNQKQHRVNPYAVLRGNLDQMLVDVEDKINKGRNHEIFLK